MNRIPHISAVYQAGKKGWDVAHELNDRVKGHGVSVKHITLRNRQDEDRCFALGSGKENGGSPVWPNG